MYSASDNIQSSADYNVTYESVSPTAQSLEIVASRCHAQYRREAL